MTSAVGRAVVLVARCGGQVARHVRSAVDPSSSGRAAGPGRPASGWLAVTVFCDPSDIDPGDPPGPLAAFGDRIELRVRAAPGGKGTELGARPRDPQPSGGALERLRASDAESDLRSALRQAKQLVEVGEVLAVDPVPHGERTPTPTGALLEAWTEVAPKAGVR